MNTENDTEANKDNENGAEENGTHLDVSNGDESPTKPRLKSASKSESTNGEVMEENKDNQSMETTNGGEEDNNNNNSSIELLNKSSPTKESLLNEQMNDPPVNLRLRITPSSASPISLTLNDSDNNNNTNDTTEIINDDEEPIEKIEGVKHGDDGITFSIKFSGQNETQWIPAKIANRKYPQAVIAFWENHVEFT